MNAVLKRRVFKATSWRILSALLTLIVVYIMTGNIAVIFALISLEALKFIFFMLHDQIWSRISYSENDTTDWTKMIPVCITVLIGVGYILALAPIV